LLFSAHRRRRTLRAGDVEQLDLEQLDLEQQRRLGGIGPRPDGP